MITIDICEEGDPISDWDVEWWVKDIIGEDIALNYDMYYTFSNFSILSLFRAELIERPELQQYFEFRVNGQPLIFNRYMVEQNSWESLPPEAELTTRASTRTILGAMKLKKEDDMLATMENLKRLGLDSLEDLELVAKKIVEENPGRNYIEQLKELRTVVKGLGLKDAVTVMRKVLGMDEQ